MGGKGRYVSCVIQINTDTKNWVSDSPYIHAFDDPERVHCQMEEEKLIEIMDEIHYSKIKEKWKIIQLKGCSEKRYILNMTKVIC